MNSKHYWISKCLESVKWSTRQRFTKEHLLTVLSKKSFNLSRDLDITNASVAKLIKRYWPQKPKNMKLDIYLLSLINKRHCTKCEQVKDFEEFYKSSQNVVGYSSWCIACQRIYKEEFFSNPVNRMLQNNRNRIKNTRQKLSVYDIQYILNRDNYKCKNCGISNEDHLIDYGTNLHVDHIIPFVKGGSNDKENLQLLCLPCNMSKGDRIIDKGN